MKTEKFTKREKVWIEIYQTYLKSNSALKDAYTARKWANDALSDFDKTFNVDTTGKNKP